MAAATATVGPAPSDVNSPQYAQWYSRWMEVYSSYSPIMPAPSSVPTALPAASVSAQQSPGRPPITKMQAAMALLKERSAGVTSSTTNTAAAEIRYISKVFSLCTPENRGAVEKHLKIMIETVKNKGALFTTDWDKMLLPGV
ncbi:hypothetical protein BC830DRAFT_1223581 [Chytriomyces sp. MP71]|nr:hypothetical protein BC830DRAFT_1223581 [Chytriomyces sp. MP71]